MNPTAILVRRSTTLLFLPEAGTHKDPGLVFASFSESVYKNGKRARERFSDPFPSGAAYAAAVAFARSEETSTPAASNC
jgi:hypothetical protein